MSRASDMAAIYRAWWNRLPAAQRTHLRETGFDPSNPGYSGVPVAHRYLDDRDLGDEHEGARPYNVDLSITRAWLDGQRDAETTMHDKTYDYAEVLDIVRKVIAPWTESQSPDVRLFGTCQYIALGVPGQPTMTELAKRHGVTRAEISRRVKHIQRKMNLPPSVYMKSDHAFQRLKRK